MTLIELMLGLSLSILMISIIFEMYLIADKSRITQNTLISIQENAQIISEILKHQIQASTYFGCQKLTDDFYFKNNSPLLLNPKNRIEHYQDGDIKKGTDAIRFWNVSTRSALLYKKMLSYSELYASRDMRIAMDDDLIISDCRTTEVFRVKEILSVDKNIQKIVTTKPLSKFYNINSELNRLEIKSYFIGATGRFDKNNNSIYALFTKDNKKNKAELVEGISEMKIFFSTLKDNKLTEYSIKELTNSGEIKSLSFNFDLTAISSYDVHKKWYLYVALS